MMSLDTFDTILRDTGDVLLLAILYGWGEPFLNKDLPRMIARCRDSGILTLTSTNGHCLQTPERAMEIVDAGLTVLIMAMDGTTQKSYAAYRKDGNLEHVRHCVELVQEAKTRRGSVTPYTNLRIVATQWNEGEIAELENLACRLGVNMFSVKSLGCLPDRKEYESFEPISRTMRRFGVGRTQVKTLPAFRCRYPFRQPTIFWDGTVVGCEFDYELTNVWGTLGQKSFMEIWNSPVATEHRRSILGKQDRPGFCTACPYHGRSKKGSIVQHVHYKNTCVRQ